MGLLTQKKCVFVSERQELTRLPVLVSVTIIAKTLMQEGSLTVSELMARTGAPKKTFYRAMNALKDAEVVIQEGGTVYWYESYQTRIYQSQFEAERALEHSRYIAQGLVSLMPGSGLLRRPGLAPDVEYAGYALAHLKAAYPKVHHAYQQAERMREQTLGEEKRFEESVLARMPPSLGLRVPRRIPQIILADIKSVLRGGGPLYLDGLSVDGEEVRSLEYTLAGKDDFESLKKFVAGEEGLEENVGAGRRIVELENSYYKFAGDFEREAGLLIVQVENGTPLKGHCPVCPRVRVQSESGSPGGKPAERGAG